MYQYLPIRDVYAREIPDLRGNPTIEVEVLAGEKTVGRAAIASITDKNSFLITARGNSRQFLLTL